MYCEQDAWRQCHPNDLWIFDKLILSIKLGYNCGPVGVDVSKPGHYIVRPTINPLGMGRNAQKTWIQDTTDHLTPGHFWCETFDGPHYSVDYVNGEQALCVQGFRETSAPLYKWSKWQRVEHRIALPLICYRLCKQYPFINCEFIGDKLIEVHLRLNPDFQEDIVEAIPVWFGEHINPPDGMRFLEYRDYRRKGLFVK